jgi:hypothetical protein
VAELGSSERIAPAVGRPASPLAIRADREFFVGMRSPESAGGPRLRPVVPERLASTALSSLTTGALVRYAGRIARNESGENENGRGAGQRARGPAGACAEHRADLPTTVPAQEFALPLADYFRAQSSAARVFRTSEDRTVMPARKESRWRHPLRVTYALTVVFTRGGQLTNTTAIPRSGHSSGPSGPVAAGAASLASE